MDSVGLWRRTGSSVDDDTLPRRVFAEFLEAMRMSARPRCPCGGRGEPVNCFDGAWLGRPADAVAVRADCGAGVFPDHAQATARWLTRTMVINRPVGVEPPARTSRCHGCRQARAAAVGQAARPVQLREGR